MVAAADPGAAAAEVAFHSDRQVEEARSDTP
jgi:hypothetical protein